MSSSTSNSTNLSNKSGCTWLRFEYERCRCRERAALKIVADVRKESYGMLYFVCEKKGREGDCGFFKWCWPRAYTSSPRNGSVEERSDDADSKNGQNPGSGSGYISIVVACFALFFGFIAFCFSLHR